MAKNIFFYLANKIKINIFEYINIKKGSTYIRLHAKLLECSA